MPTRKRREPTLLEDKCAAADKIAGFSTVKWGVGSVLLRSAADFVAAALVVRIEGPYRNNKAGIIK